MTDITLAQVVHMLVVETHLLQAILTVILQLANPLLEQSWIFKCEAIYDGILSVVIEIQVLQQLILSGTEGVLRNTDPQVKHIAGGNGFVLRNFAAPFPSMP